MSRNPHMKTLSITELRASLARLEGLFKHESEIIVTRGGRAIARIIPVRGMPSRAELRASMPRTKVPSEVLIREDRDAR